MKQRLEESYENKFLHFEYKHGVLTITREYIDHSDNIEYKFVIDLDNVWMVYNSSLGPLEDYGVGGGKGKGSCHLHFCLKKPYTNPEGTQSLVLKLIFIGQEVAAIPLVLDIFEKHLHKTKKKKEKKNSKKKSKIEKLTELQKAFEE